MSKIETNFYLSDELIKSLTPLLLKILEDKKTALILCEDKRLKEIDDALWSFSKLKFIPHASPFDKEIIAEFGEKSQPVFVTSKQENSNDAQYLVVIDEISQIKKDFFKNFQKVFYFYNFDKEEEAKSFVDKSDFLKITSYKKSDGKWVKN